MTLATALAIQGIEATEAIIYLRLSDFRDDDDTTFEVREAELREFAASLGLTVRRVARENDLNGNGKAGGASAYKTPRQVRTPSGLITFRTRRPVFEGVVLELQASPEPLVLIVSDDSRISRNHRDGADLLDACRVSGASAVAPDDDGQPRWILTNGGSHDQVSAFQDRINDARRYSDEVAAKVRKGRRRWAGKSYHGGRRPFGYQVAQGTSEHHRNLAVDPAEAAVIREAATGILDRGISLKAIARDLRERDVPTVTGARWSAETLREALIKPTVAGLAVHPATRELTGAPWQPILDRPRWERLRDKLTDPARRTNASRANEPRWLVSGFATCGTCGGTVRVSGGRAKAHAYVGAACCHLRRDAAKVDDLIEALVLARLSEPDVASILRPPARPGVDAKALNAEKRRLAGERKTLVRMHVAKRIDDDDLETGIQDIRDRLQAIDAQLAASADEPDLLAEFRAADPARAVWAALPMPRRRAVVQKLFASIVIERAGRTGGLYEVDERTGRARRVFDPELIKVAWNHELAR
jgi:DNA invertase Pin-like site-specific DNA recombinase